MTVQEAGLGGWGEDNQDFPTSPADGKWRTKGLLDAARCPEPLSERETVGRGLKGRTLQPASPASPQVAETFAIGTRLCDANLHPASFYLRPPPRRSCLGCGEGRGRSPPTCLIDLLAHHLLFPLILDPNLSITHLIHSFLHSHFFLHYSSNLLFTPHFAIYVFRAFINLQIYNVSTYLSTIWFIVSLFILSY